MHECVCLCVCLLCCAALHFTSLQSSWLILKHKKNILDLFFLCFYGQFSAWVFCSVSSFTVVFLCCCRCCTTFWTRRVLATNWVAHRVGASLLRKAPPKKVACIRKRFFMPQLEILVWKLQQREQALRLSLLFSFFLLLSFTSLAKRAENKLWSLFA